MIHNIIHVLIFLCCFTASIFGLAHLMYVSIKKPKWSEDKFDVFFWLLLSSGALFFFVDVFTHFVYRF